jgi:hypothetical protein
VLETDWLILVIGILITATSGMIYLYNTRPFGTPLDYLLAALWGFGVDFAALNGLSTLLSKVGLALPIGVAAAATKSAPAASKG